MKSETADDTEAPETNPTEAEFVDANWAVSAYRVFKYWIKKIIEKLHKSSNLFYSSIILISNTEQTSFTR